jgi:hypothetical protein
MYVGDEGIVVMRRRTMTMMGKPSLIETGGIGKKMALEIRRRWVYHHDHGMKQH